MLKATTTIKQLFEESVLDEELLVELNEFVAIHGNAEDFAYLRELILNNIGHFINFIKIFWHRNSIDDSFPDAFLKSTIENDRLIKDIPEEALSLLGLFKLQETVSVLWWYAIHSHDFELSRYAVEGLHYLDCSEIKDSIETEILNCKGKGLFNEFVPALAYKTGNEELLPFLLEIGKTASTDCMGGLIEAPAYYGNIGRSYFEKIWFNSAWETWDAGTGNGTSLYRAIKKLDISFADIYDELLSNIKSGNVDYCFNIVGTILWRCIFDFKSNYGFGLKHSPKEVKAIFFPDYDTREDLIDLTRNNIKDDYFQEVLVTDFYEIDRTLVQLQKELIQREIVSTELNNASV